MIGSYKPITYEDNFSALLSTELLIMKREPITNSQKKKGRIICMHFFLHAKYVTHVVSFP